LLQHLPQLPQLLHLLQEALNQPLWAASREADVVTGTERSILVRPAYCRVIVRSRVAVTESLSQWPEIVEIAACQVLLIPLSPCFDLLHALTQPLALLQRLANHPICLAVSSQPHLLAIG
jgi:hypothetical protein